MRCRFCGTELKHVFIDLLNSPLSNSYLTAEQLSQPEVFYPLRVFVCDSCFLVQIDEYKKSKEIFNENYAYFSSYSKTWLEHSRNYVEMITKRLGLHENSKVIEIACNDGYLLQYFSKKGIPCLGIEPTASTANAARAKGIQVIEDFFGERLAGSIGKADLILGNNVLAHVPNINDFVRGLKIALKPRGSITMEFPHILNLIRYNQFDTIYHEHFSYLSLLTVERIFIYHGLTIYDVDELSTHGGSLRIYAAHSSENFNVSDNVGVVISREKEAGLENMQGYSVLADKIQRIKFDFLNFLLEARRTDKIVAAYGAAAKGNTLLNYCGIKNDLIRFVVDAAPSKQGKYLPGSHIPIMNEDILKEIKPDYIIIFPWNIKEEVVNQIKYVGEWGCQFVVLIPRFTIIN